MLVAAALIVTSAAPNVGTVILAFLTGDVIASHWQ